MAHQTPQKAAETDHGATALGTAVRAGRTRLGLSVQGLAERAGVSLGLVSQVERGISNPSLQSIQRIAAALGISASRLLEPPAHAITIVPADKRHVLSDEDPEGGADAEIQQAHRELLSPADESRIQLIRTVLPSGFSNAERPYRHIGTESITVLEGVLELGHGKQRHLLSAGDSATYGTSTPHWWANGGDGETVVLGAFSPVER